MQLNGPWLITYPLLFRGEVGSRKSKARLAADMTKRQVRGAGKCTVQQTQQMHDQQEAV